MRDQGSAKAGDRASQIYDSHIPCVRDRTASLLWCRSTLEQRAAPSYLAAQAQLRYEGLVSISVNFPEVIEQAAALAHHLQKTAARVVVLHVRVEMLRQLVNARRQERNLNFGRARIRLVRAVLLDHLCGRQNDLLETGALPPRRRCLSERRGAGNQPPAQSAHALGGNTRSG